MAKPELIHRLDELGTSRYIGPGWRHVGPGVSPMSGRASSRRGGRWNPSNSWDTLYLGTSEDTARAEFLRHAKLVALEPESLLPRKVLLFDVELSRCVDLREINVLREFGITNLALSGTDRTVCQDLGVAAHYLGAEALIAPSATGIGEVIAVFLDKQLQGSKIILKLQSMWDEVPTVGRGDV